jgi:hypothetical protein
MNDPQRSSAPLVTADQTGADRRERMQRVRVGLTGLAVVLLIVFLATLVFTNVRTDGPANTVAGQAPDEPLAELGITPGSSVDNTASPPSPKAKPTR